MADSNGTKVSSSEKVQKSAERPKDKITELNLDNCRKENIFSIVEEHPALEALSLINANLSTLKGFPKLANLKRLRLSDNRITEGLDYLSNSPKLQSLDLSGNKIKEFDVLQALQEFKQLANLDLYNNEVTNTEKYREKVFKLLPSLKYLDGMDVNMTPPSDDEDDDDLNGNDSEDEDSEDDLDDYDEDGEEEEDEEEDVALAEIYNKYLEEDNSDWEEEEGGEDDDDEIESDDENETSAVAKDEEKEPEADEPTNKKRKTAE